MMDAQEATAILTATRILLAVWCAISTLEWAANASLFRDDGLLCWRVLALRSGRIFRSALVRTTLWRQPIMVLLGARLAAVAVLLATGRPSLICLALLTILASSWLLTVRSWLGSDGADQMGQVVTVGALLMAAGRLIGSDLTSFAGALLVGGQLTLAYFTAGVSKLGSPEWRNGSALVGVMGTHSYGHPLGARVLTANRVVPLVFGWFVILAETAFPLAILTPRPALVSVLILMLVLHVLNGYLMGLNLFIWAFVAAYPSVLALHAAIHR